MAEDDILLESYQTVLLAGKCSFRENLGGFLEACCRDEAFRLYRCLGYAQQLGRACGRQWSRGGGSLPIRLFDTGLRTVHRVTVPVVSIGNLTVFLQTLFSGLSPAVSTGLLGWELFNLDRVFVTRVVKE